MKKYAAENSKELNQYLESVFLKKDPFFEKILQLARKKNLPPIELSPYDGHLLHVLAKMNHAKTVVEIGTLGGYSGIHIARALPHDGHLYTFEKEKSHAELAEEVFRLAGLHEKVTVIQGEALKTLSSIENKGPFDMVFVDADKNNYPNYFRWAQKNIKVGGLIVGDNTLGFGHITDKEFEDEDLKKQVENLREFNTLCAQTEGFTGMMVPTGEGLTISVRTDC